MMINFALIKLNAGKSFFLSLASHQFEKQTEPITGFITSNHLIDRRLSVSHSLIIES